MPLAHKKIKDCAQFFIENRKVLFRSTFLSFCLIFPLLLFLFYGNMEIEWRLLMKWIHSLINEVKNFDKKTTFLLKKGLFFSLLLALFSTFLLAFYDGLFAFPVLFKIGISLLRTSLMFAITFFICAIGFDTIKKEWN